MKRFNSLFYYLALSNLLFFLGNSMYVLLPVFLKGLGASESYIGVVSNADKIVTIITAAGVGSLMFGRDRLKLLRIGYVILLLSFSTYFFISSISWIIFAIRVIHGMGFTLALIVCSTMVFDVVPVEDAAEGIAIFGITGVLSNAFSPMIGEVLISNGLSFKFIFSLSIVLVMSAIVITYIMPRIPVKVSTKTISKSNSAIEMFRNPQFFLVILSTLIIGGCFGVIITYIPNFVRSSTPFKFSYFFIPYVIVIIGIRMTSLGSVYRYNKNMIIGVLFVLCIIGSILFNFVLAVGILIFIAVLYGISNGVLYPMLNALAVSSVERCDRDKANALFNGFFSCGVMIFPMIFGFMIDYFRTYLAAFNSCAVLFAAGLIPVIMISLKNVGQIKD